VNRPCSHLRHFCATGVSSGLATRVTLTRVSRGRLGVSITRGWTCFWSNFCTWLLGFVVSGAVCIYNVAKNGNYWECTWMTFNIKNTRQWKERMKIQGSHLQSSVGRCNLSFLLGRSRLCSNNELM
jgi:hypothetical protein